MKYLYLLINVLLISNLSYAQAVQAEEGEFEALRQEHFFKMRCFSDSTMPDLWQTFQQIRQQSISNRNTIPAANWQSLGPNTLDSLGGRITCHAFNPFNSEVLLAGSSTGGLWKSTNGGESWTVLTDDLPSLRVSAVAYNPLDTNHILIGTGHYATGSFTLQAGVGLLESFDGGNSWSSNNLSFPFSNGIGISRIIWDQDNPDNIYVGASNGLWLSRDQGMLWENNLGGIITDLEINRKTPHKLYATVHSTGIYESVDAGENWTILTNGLPSATLMHRINLAICDSFPNYMLASIVNPNDFSLTGLYKTNDGGNSWAAVSNPPNYLCNTSCLGWFVNVVAISPVDTNYITLGGPRLFTTTDGGNNWHWVDYYSNGFGEDNIGLAYVDQWDAGYDPENTNTLYIFNDGGVHKSLDGGAFFSKKNNGLVTAQFYRIASYPGDTNLIIGGLQDHGLYHLDNTNGNNNWKQWYIGDGCGVSFDPNNPNKVYGDNLFAFHYRSNNVTGGLFSTLNMNGGITGSNTIPFHFVTVHHPTSSNVLYTANDNFIFKSTNGLSWTNIANIPSVRTIAISPIEPSTVYAASWNNSSWSFHVSFDGGDLWTQQGTPGWRVTDVEADPNIYGRVYATRNSSLAGRAHVYRSDDHGVTWADMGINLPDVSTNTLALNPFNPEVVYVGTDLGVYISENAGLTFVEYNDNLPPYYVMDMHYHRMDSTLRVGTLGRGVWKTKSIIADQISSTKPAKKPTSFEINTFPNPFRDQIRIDLKNSKSGLFTIEVVNEMGQTIKALHHGFLLQGRFEYNWGGDNGIAQKLPAGVYYLRVTAQGQNHFLKLVKQ